MAEPALLPLAWRIARRELRSGLSGFRIFLACLALGVFAIAAVGSVASSMIAALDRNSRDMLGGDLEFSLAQKELAPDARQFLAFQGRLSEIRLLRGMLRASDDAAQALIELKSVDSAYPLIGQIVLDPAMPLADALAVHDNVAGIVVEQTLLDRLHVGVGAEVLLGSARVQIRAVIVKEPDNGISPFVLGPRVIISDAGLDLTGLNKPGTLSSESFRLLLPDKMSPSSVMAKAQAAFPDAGWQIKTLKNAAQGIETFVDRTSLFLSLVGLTALLVGGIGVGNAVSSYLAGKASIIATLKCLGAPSRLVVTIYLLQIMTLAIGGIVVGIALGAVSPWLAQAIFGDFLPIPLVLRLFPRALLIAAGFGVLTSLSFTLLPLIRVRGVAPAGLFRGLVSPGTTRITLIDGVVLGALAVSLAALAILTADDKRLAIWFVISVVFTLASFWAMGVLIVLAARHAPVTRIAWLRLAIANLHRPGAPTGSIVVSMGLGLAVLVGVTLVQTSLSDSIGSRLTERAPSFFFIDIQPDQVADFRKLVTDAPGVSGFNLVPNMRTRVTAMNGVPVAQAVIDPGQRPMVESDRGLSYSATIPPGSTIVQGQWWPRDYQGEPLVSVEERFAEGLHLRPGDHLSFDIAGRTITAKVANLRRVDWMSLGINFFSVFAPGALDHAPQTAIATVRAASSADEEALAKNITGHFPNVSSIRVKDGLARVTKILSGLAAAIRATAAITLATGVLVLIGAVAAGHRRRIRELVILKVLGATRAKIVWGLMVEYGILGLAIAGLSTLFGSIGAALLLSSVMQIDMVFSWSGVLPIVVGATALTIAVAVAATWRILSLRPAPYLRIE